MPSPSSGVQGLRFDLPVKTTSKRTKYKTQIITIRKQYFLRTFYGLLFPVWPVKQPIYRMGKQRGPIFLERTIGPLIFYKRNGHYYVRIKPRMPNVRKDRRFRATMRSAGCMARASKIGSALYAVLPEGLKQFKRYRAWTGEAYRLLKAGQTDEQALEVLWGRLKDLIERSCAIAMAVYDGLGTGFRQEWMLWSFAAEAMEMIKEGRFDEDVLTALWTVYAGEFESGYREEKAFVHGPRADKPAVALKKNAGIPKLMLVPPVGKVAGRWYVTSSATGHRHLVLKAAPRAGNKRRRRVSVIT